MERTLRGAMKVKRLRNVPWVSGMLVVINVIVFLMCTFSGNVLYNKGELDVVSVLAGKQYGRLLWAMFLHAQGKPQGEHKRTAPGGRGADRPAIETVKNNIKNAHSFEYEWAFLVPWFYTGILFI